MCRILASYCVRALQCKSSINLFPFYISCFSIVSLSICRSVRLVRLVPSSQHNWWAGLLQMPVPNEVPVKKMQMQQRWCKMQLALPQKSELSESWQCPHFNIVLKLLEMYSNYLTIILSIHPTRSRDRGVCFCTFTKQNYLMSLNRQAILTG